MAQKWPVNPLDQIIQDIRMNHKQKIVADFGCGDAKLGASLSKTNKVYSFDLVSRNEQVIACDIAKVGVTQLTLIDLNVTVYIT